ncbi:MAG TPA: hypothetical protein VG820_07390, partial [Fimbriimonadaceae bacterium]|nr:hypothetical protein [Fimbriimonadaceae bacterium]
VLRAELAGAAGSLTWISLDKPKRIMLGESSVSARIGPDLQVEVEGYVQDLVIWDPADPENVYDPATEQAGWKPVTLANGTARLGLRYTPRELRGRSLAGRHDIAVTPVTVATAAPG